MLCGGELRHEFALRRQHHERYAEDSVGASGEDSEVEVLTSHFELHLRTLTSAYPVLLCLLDRVAPVDSLQTVEQALRVSRCAQTPLLHLLLHDGEAAALAHAVHHLVVGKHRAQTGAPVHHRLAEVSDAVVHERLLLLHVAHGAPLFCCELQMLALGDIQTLGALLVEVLYELLNRLRLLARVAEERAEHLLERPLSPVVVLRVAGANLAVPVEREANVVELLTIACDVSHGSHLRVLTGLYSILLSGQSVCVVAHRVEHVEALQALVACVDVRCDIAKRMAYVQTGSRRVGEHVEYVELLLCRVLSGVVSLVLHPLALPSLFYFSEVVFH